MTLQYDEHGVPIKPTPPPRRCLCGAIVGEDGKPPCWCKLTDDVFYSVVPVGLALAIFILVLGANARSQEPSCQTWEPPAGSILLSVNTNGDNRTSGYWNHSAHYAGGGYIVESQTGIYGNGVQQRTLAEYLDRPYLVAYMPPRDRPLGQRAAAISVTQVGRPYRRTSSLAPNFIPRIVPRIIFGTEYGQNCVTTAIEPYAIAMGQPIYGVHTPDDITRLQQLFEGPYWYPRQVSQPLPSQVPSVPGGMGP